MPSRFHRPLLVVAALAMSAGGATAQGYTVRSWGYFDQWPYPPVSGGTFSYTIGGRPTVTLQDPWGRIIDMPLQPKVLYYDTPFLTQQGWYRPISIAVMPDSRPRTYLPGQPRTNVVPPPPAASTVPPPPAAASQVPAAPAPQAMPPAGRSSVLPDLKSTGPIPTVPLNPPRAEQPGLGPAPPAAAQPADRPVPKPPTSGLPPVPKVPDLPTLPRVPDTDTGPAVPKVFPPQPKDR